jgi:hypothetical protein
MPWYAYAFVAVIVAVALALMWQMWPRDGGG